MLQRNILKKSKGLKHFQNLRLSFGKSLRLSQLWEHQNLLDSAVKLPLTRHN